MYTPAAGLCRHHEQKREELQPGVWQRAGEKRFADSHDAAANAWLLALQQAPSAGPISAIRGIL